MSANVAGLLRERAARHPERTAIVQYCGGRARRVTFAGLEEAALRLAAALEARGIGAGDRVLVFVPMSIELYITLLACLHRGAPAVFLDAWSDRERLDAAVRAALPQAAVASRKAHLLRLLSPAMRRIPCWLMPQAVGAPVSRAPARVSPETPALVTFTTGSTGEPKGAVRSHGLLMAQHRTLQGYLRLEDRDVDMPTLPIFVLNNLALGVTSVLPDMDPRRPAEIRPGVVYRQILAEGVTTSSGSPAFYARLGAWCGERGLRLPLRALFTGGAPVLPPLARLLLEVTEGEAHAVYGSTEAEPIAGIPLREMLQAVEDERGPQAGLPAGQPVEGLHLRLIRAQPVPEVSNSGPGGTFLEAEGEGGELAVAGEHVLPGYLDSEDGKQKFRDGGTLWHRTGDGARLDAEGRLWLLGRVRDAVRRPDGLWWSLPAELAALAVPGVGDAAYFALGERAVLCVAPVAGSAGPDADVLREAVAPAPVDEVQVLRRLPKDPRHQSKHDLSRLEQLISGGKNTLLQA